MVAERIRVILLVTPITVKFHVNRVVSVAVHVTSSSSPTRHSATLGEGDTVTAPII